MDKFFDFRFKMFSLLPSFTPSLSLFLFTLRLTTTHHDIIDRSYLPHLSYYGRWGVITTGVGLGTLDT